MTNPLNSPEFIERASAFLYGFQHEFEQGERVMELMESEVTRQFAVNFAQTYSKWHEKQTMTEHDARRFLSCMAIGTAAVVGVALAQRQGPS